MRTTCHVWERTRAVSTLVLVLAALPLASAHYGTPLSDAELPTPAPLFGLPFAGDPGPDSWLLGQPYGNTVYAYHYRNLYSSAQGVHFGLDFSAPCGTPVLAIGSGRVTEVDGPHGLAPHYVAVAHESGFSSVYGHLSEVSVSVGQEVGRGDTLGLSGDSEFTCDSEPHLHLELRDASHTRFFNPVPYLEADFSALALLNFERFNDDEFILDLDNPRRWQFLDDQPEVRLGGPMLNSYDQPWPLGRYNRR